MIRCGRFVNLKLGEETIMVFKLIVPTSFPVLKVASIKLSDARVKDSNYFYKSLRLLIKNAGEMLV